jgi:hypothetical protein
VECWAFARLRMETHWGWVEAVGVIEMSPGIGIARAWDGCGGGFGEVAEVEGKIRSIELVTRRWRLTLAQGRMKSLGCSERGTFAEGVVDRLVGSTDGSSARFRRSRSPFGVEGGPALKGACLFLSDRF